MANKKREVSFRKHHNLMTDMPRIYMCVFEISMALWDTPPSRLGAGV